MATKKATSKKAVLPKSFEHACEMLGLNPDRVLRWKNPKNADQEADNARKRVETIVKAANGDWKPDYNDSNQQKWYPWFVYNSRLRRFRFNGTDFGYTYACAGTGARLVTKDDKTATYIGKRFVAEFNKFLLPG